MSNILSIDVGHGHVKVVHRPATGMQVRTVFPAFALPVVKGDDAAAALASGFKVITVDVDGQSFCVGKDIEMVLPANVERNRDDNYSDTPAYLALVRGALFYARSHVIDVLVVGLPLSTLAAGHAALKERLEGVHTIPDFDNPSKNTTVTVRKVQVLAQPVGALFAAGKQEPSLSSARVLTLDFGFHTLDVLASHGMRPFPQRLGAIPGGVADYIDQLQKSVASQIRREKPDLRGEFRAPTNLYEEALKSKPGHRKVHLAPGVYDLEAHRSSAEARLDVALQKAAALIGTANDITCIVLAGGGAPLLEEAVRRQFPEVSNVITLEDPQFSIAQGYLIAGERVASFEQEHRHAA